MVTTSIELHPARAALRAAASRSAELIASLPDLEGRVAKSDWTVADAAAHLVVGLSGYADAARGAVEEWRPMIPDAATYADRVAGLNRATIAAQPARSPAAAGRAIIEAADAFLEATAGRSAAQRIPTPWYRDDASLSVLSATCLLTGEQLIHGRDIARGVGRKWKISPEEAALVFQAIPAMMPLAVNPEASRGLHATYDMRAGRAGRFVVQVSGASATVDPPGRARIDCHIAGTPLALLLVGYGRISQWQAIGTGRLIAWGRKPWLGFRFVHLFYNP